MHIISTIILVWLLIDIALFPNFSQFVFDPTLGDSKPWKGILLIITFLPLVVSFMLYKGFAKLWRN